MTRFYRYMTEEVSEVRWVYCILWFFTVLALIQALLEIFV